MRVNIKISVNNKSLHSIVVLAMLIVGCMCLVNAQQKEPKLVLEKKITVDFPGNRPRGSLYITDDGYILQKGSEKFYIYGRELEFYDKKWRLKSKMKIEPWKGIYAVSENGKYLGESTTVSYRKAAFKEIFTLKDRDGNVIWEKKIRHKDVIISNDGSVVMTGCAGECFKGRDLYFFDSKGNLIKKIETDAFSGAPIIISKDGKIVMTTAWLKTGEKGTTIFDNKGNILWNYQEGWFRKFSKNGKYLIFEKPDGSISYYDRKGNIVEEIELDDDEVNYIHEKSNKFKIYNLKEKKVVKEIKLEEVIPDIPRVKHVKILQDRKSIIVYSESNTLWLLRLKQD